jgi:hypothetical protein
MGLLGVLLYRKSDHSIRNGSLLYKQLFRAMMDYVCPALGPLPAPTSQSCRCCNTSVFFLRLPPLSCWQENSRGSGCSAFCRPHHTHYCEHWLKIGWRKEPPSSATRQILTLTEGLPHRLTRMPRDAGSSRPVEAIAR